MTTLERVLLKFARAALADETCQQGWTDPCGRPAAYEAIHSGHIMCGACTRAWYDIKPTEREEYDDADVKSGLIRKTKTGWAKRIEARRRDDAAAESKLSREAVEALLTLESRYRKREGLKRRPDQG